VGINNTAPTVALEVAGSANITTNVNSALFTVGSNFIANSTAIVSTGYANVTTSVNSASLTVGTNFIANTTGAYHTGVVNAASHTTTGITANVSGVYPTTNSIGTALGSSTNRWVVTANTGDFSTSVGISTINSTSNGFFANSTTASLGNATDNVSISYAGIIISGADGITPYSNIKGNILGTSSKRWNLYATDGDFSGNVVISGNLTVSGTTTYINTTNLNVGDNIVVLNADVTNVTAPTENAGLEINRGSSANVSFLWNETTDAWNLGNTAISGSATVSGTAAAGNTTITGFANVSTSVNSALLTVGTSLIANTLGVFHTGTVNAASITTGNGGAIGILANTIALVPTGTGTNANTVLLGNSTNRWVLSANTGNFSGAVVFGTTISANGTTGTAKQVLLSSGTANAYWGSATEFSDDLYIRSNSPRLYLNDTNETLSSNTVYLTYNSGDIDLVNAPPGGSLDTRFTFRMADGSFIMTSNTPQIYFQDANNTTATANAMYAQFNAGSFTLVQSTDGTAANTRFTFAMTSGNLTIDGELSATSDERRKSNIVTVDSALAKVESMRGVYFNRNDREGRHVGVIAQEIQKVLPEVVSEDDDGYLSVSYGNIVGVLIEAIKELKQEIEELKNGNKS
jgi:hypothetical protein